MLLRLTEASWSQGSRRERRIENLCNRTSALFNHYFFIEWKRCWDRWTPIGQLFGLHRWYLSRTGSQRGHWRRPLFLYVRFFLLRQKFCLFRPSFGWARQLWPSQLAYHGWFSDSVNGAKFRWSRPSQEDCEKVFGRQPEDKQSCYRNYFALGLDRSKYPGFFKGDVGPHRTPPDDSQQVYDWPPVT